MPLRWHLPLTVVGLFDNLLIVVRREEAENHEEQDLEKFWQVAKFVIIIIYTDATHQLKTRQRDAQWIFPKDVRFHFYRVGLKSVVFWSLIRAIVNFENLSYVIIVFYSLFNEVNEEYKTSKQNLSQFFVISPKLSEKFIFHYSELFLK